MSVFCRNMKALMYFGIVICLISCNSNTVIPIEEKGARTECHQDSAKALLISLLAMSIRSSAHGKPDATLINKEIITADGVKVKFHDRFNTLLEIGQFRKVIEPFEESIAAVPASALDVYISYRCEDAYTIFEEINKKFDNNQNVTWAHMIFDSYKDGSQMDTDSLSGLLYFFSGRK